MSGRSFKSEPDGSLEAPPVDCGDVGGGGECEVLRAMYDFKATIEQTIDFARNDIFILHSSSNKQKNWWHVINSEGKVGYIPSNYVETVSVSSQFLVGFISKCMSGIQKSLTSERERAEGGGSKRHQLLKELAERKRRAEGGMRSPIPPRPPTRSSTPDQHTPNKTLKKSATAQSISTTVKQPITTSISNSIDCVGESPAANREEPAPVHSDSAPSELAAPEEVSNKKNSEEVPSAVESATISAEDTYRLVQKVRLHTTLSYELSRVAVEVVASSLLQLLPSAAAQPLEVLLCTLQQPDAPAVSPELLDETHDARRMAVVLQELVDCKEDSQQRSWELYEDEATILEYLAELTSIIKNADPVISRRVLSRDKCRDVEQLLAYYQMEVRWSIRCQLLDLFLAVCSLHHIFVLLFLNSVLPVELARDMQSNVKDVPKLINSAKLLTVILSMGEPMPITHLEQLGEEFVDFLLSLIENPPENNEQISEEFFVVVVSYNLQFVPQSPNNIVVEALANRSGATNFTEKLLFVLNREDDPVRAITEQKKYSNSVLKLIVDIFVSRKAANLFYTNDINVLIDIIVRQLTDLSPGDEKRTLYLKLCRLVLRNTNYSEHQHRCEDLHKCFIHIFCEETEASHADQALVRDISNEFPQYFKT